MKERPNETEQTMKTTPERDTMQKHQRKIAPTKKRDETNNNETEQNSHNEKRNGEPHNQTTAQPQNSTKQQWKNMKTLNKKATKPQQSIIETTKQ